MSEKLTKRDVLLFTWMMSAPFISFMLVVLDDNMLVTMMEEPWSKLFFGVGVSVFWLAFFGIGAFIDELLKKKEERKKVEFNDPAMAFGQYLFDKNKD